MSWWLIRLSGNNHFVSRGSAPSNAEANVNVLKGALYMAGGSPEGAGRKAVKIDLLELEKLCSMLCSDDDIASWYGVSVRTIKYRRKEPEFSEAMRRGKTRGYVSIRRAQMKLLEKGSATMAVWLGRSELGQRDTSSIRMVRPKI